MTQLSNVSTLSPGEALGGAFPGDRQHARPSSRRTAPVRRTRRRELNPPRDGSPLPEGVIDVSRPEDGRLTYPRSIGAFAGAAALTLVIPLVVLAVGTPLAAALRLVLEAVGWLTAALP